MGNPFIPFPRNENIIIVGDTASEILGALRIFGKGLIGGEVPSMELRHPNEKHLECIYIRSGRAGRTCDCRREGGRGYCGCLSIGAYGSRRKHCSWYASGSWPEAFDRFEMPALD